jgi:hypothetical protein
MACFASIILLMNLLCSPAAAPADGADVFTSEEEAKLEKTAKADSRIKIYRKVSERIQEKLEKSVAKGEFDTVPELLKQWTSLLTTALDDIETNLKAKKKTRNLVNFEISVRKAIDNTHRYKIKAPAEQQDAFDACIDQAEKVHRKIVDILFKL